MAEPRTPLSPGLRMLIDFGPLATFFAVNAFASGPAIARAITATIAFMVAMVVALSVSWWRARHISPMLWITALFVLVFGSLTVYFHDEAFIKAKPVAGDIKAGEAFLKGLTPFVFR